MSCLCLPNRLAYRGGDGREAGMGGFDRPKGTITNTHRPLRASSARPQGTSSRPTAARRGRRTRSSRATFRPRSRRRSRRRSPRPATRATPATGTARGCSARPGPAGPRTAGRRCRCGGGSARSAGSSASTPRTYPCSEGRLVCQPNV